MSQVSWPDMAPVLVAIITGFFGLAGLVLSTRRKNSASHDTTDSKLDEVIEDLRMLKVDVADTRADAREVRGEMREINVRLKRLEHS